MEQTKLSFADLEESLSALRIHHQAVTIPAAIAVHHPLIISTMQRPQEQHWRRYGEIATKSITEEWRRSRTSDIHWATRIRTVVHWYTTRECRKPAGCQISCGDAKIPWEFYLEGCQIPCGDAKIPREFYSGVPNPLGYPILWHRSSFRSAKSGPVSEHQWTPRLVDPQSTDPKTSGLPPEQVDPMALLYSKAACNL